MAKSDTPVKEDGYSSTVKKVLNVDSDGNAITEDNPLPVLAELEVSDIQIGAVEIKDGDSNVRAEVDDNNALVTKLRDANGSDITNQNPMPSSLDSIYESDIDVANSSNGDFSGSITDYFNSLQTINSDTTSNNPKTIRIQFKRTHQVSSIGFGCNDPGLGFGQSITIRVLGSAGELRQEKISSSGDENSRVINLIPATANTIEISFNTTTTVSLSNLYIAKTTNSNASIQALKPNGELTNIGATNNDNLKISVQEYGDTPAVDAFARLRTSDPFTIFDSKQLHDKQPLFWDESIGNNATSIHSPTDARTRIEVTADVNDYVIRQTKQRFNYQPGKSQLIFLTFFNEQVSGLTKRVGVFDGTGTNFLTPNNGIFYETNGEISWNIAKGGIITESVTQSNWNIDMLDGTGPSGITLNTDSTQIAIIDFEWLGVGRVRVGFVIDGLIYYVHDFNHANNPSFTSVYMSTPNLPIRYDIQTDGTNAGYLDHICSTVISEGGIEETGILRSVDTDFNHINASSANTTYAVVGIRLKDTHLDVTVIPESISMINENNDDFRWSLHLNPTIAGTLTWNDVDFSAIQFAKGATNGSNTLDIDSGTVLNSGYASIDTLSANQQLKTALKIGSQIDGTRDILVLAVTPLSGGADIHGSLGFRELL